MLKQGSSDPTSPRREASLFDLPGSSEPGLFFWGSAILVNSVVTGLAARSGNMSSAAAQRWRCLGGPAKIPAVTSSDAHGLTLARHRLCKSQ